MPRNGSGSFSLAEAAFVPNTPISSSAVNSDLSDIADALTGSLARDGQGGMTAVLPMANTGFTYLTDPNTGMRRTAADTQAISAGGVDAVTITSTAVDVVALKVAGVTVFPVPTAQIADKAVTLAKLYHPTATSRLLGTDSNAALVITGAANNGSGLIRLTVASTATFATSQVKTVSDVLGTTEANGTWTITVVDATHIDLQGSTFTNAYVSGGTIGGGVEEISLGAGLALTGSVLSSTLDPALVPGYISGLTLSTAGSSTSFGIAAGAANDVASGGMMVLAAAITKTTASWAVGSGNGALDTGSIATSTWYHVYEIKRPDTGVVDVLISLSATAPTMPANYTLKRRIGSMRTDGSSNWLAFTQTYDTFIWATSFLDMNAVTGSTSNVLQTLTVPTGLVVAALYRASITIVGALSQSTIFFSPQENSVAPSSTNSDLSLTSVAGNTLVTAGNFEKLTNTSAQLLVRSSSTNGTINLNTYGWKDTRGK